MLEVKEMEWIKKTRWQQGLKSEARRKQEFKQMFLDAYDIHHQKVLHWSLWHLFSPSFTLSLFLSLFSLSTSLFYFIPFFLEKQEGRMKKESLFDICLKVSFFQTKSGREELVEITTRRKEVEWKKRSFTLIFEKKKNSEEENQRPKEHRFSFISKSR